MFLVRVLLLWDFLFWLGLPYISRFWPHIYAISTEIFMKNRSIWYSTGSSPGDLPNEREISDSFICEQFFYRNPLIEPHKKSSKNIWKCGVCSIFRFFSFYFLIFRLQLAALTVRRPKHPVWPCCTTIFYGEKFEDSSPEILIWNTIHRSHQTTISGY